MKTIPDLCATPSLRAVPLVALATIGLLVLVAPSQSASAEENELRWLPSASPDVVGYRLHFGSEPGFYDTGSIAGTIEIGSAFSLVAGVASRPLAGLISAPSWVVLTAYNSTGVESEPSNQLLLDPLQGLDDCPNDPACDDEDPSAFGLLPDSIADGEDPPGWLDTGEGNSLVEADLFELMQRADGGSDYLVFGTRSDATNIHSHWLLAATPDGNTAYGYEMSGRMLYSLPRGGLGVTLYSDYPNSDSYYRLRRFGSGTFHLSHHTDHSCVGDSDTGVLPDADIWYRFRFRALDESSGTRLQAKVWPAGSAEPLGWQADCLNDSPAHLTGGAPGVWSMGEGEKYWDDLALSPAQADAGLPYFPQPVPQPECLSDDDCGDGDVCTGIERCVEGSCSEAAALECGDPGLCGVALCDAVLGCTVEPVSDGTLCGEGDACSAPDACSDGVCRSGAPTTCPDPGECYVGRCDPVLGCDPEPMPDGSACDDGSLATLNDVCRAGSCEGTLPPAAEDDPTPEEPPADESGEPSESDESGEFARRLFDFAEVLAGEDPPGWLDTGASNSLAEADDFKIFDLMGGTPPDESRGSLVFGTTATQTNIHSHYLAAESQEWFDYELQGRMLIERANAGIGVTLYSDYPDSDSYYRLRRYASRSFHLSPHPDGSCIGVSNTGVRPEAGVWYSFRFRAVGEDDGTRLQAKVWRAELSEPADWQADCLDDSPARRTAGAPGLWSMGRGGKYWGELTVVSAQPNEQLPFMPELECLNDGDCSDADVCTGIERCVEGSCSDAAPLECDAAGLCGVAICDATLGCTVEPALNGTLCGDGDACSAPDTCSDGMCLAGASASCPDPGECYVGRCDPVAGCDPEPMPDGTACDDGSLATQNDVCRAGSCRGTLPATVEDDPTSEAPPIGESGSLLFDFEDSLPGEDPAGWLDTRPKNSLDEADHYKIFDLADGSRVFGTTRRRTNTHSHYVADESHAWFDYELRGRMLIDRDDAGIGVTIYSDYPRSDSYYRLRHYGEGVFELANHPGDGGICEGLTSTSLRPLAGVWYRFRLQAFDELPDTRVRAKVWREDETEPEVWEIDCLAPADEAYFAGSPGLWSMGRGGKYWDDLEMIELNELSESGEVELP